MRLVTLNIWGGRVHEPLFNFLNTNKDSVDIFCFQEVYKSDRDVITNKNRSNILREISEILTDFNYYFHPMAEGKDTEGNVDFPLLVGQATFVRKNIKIKNRGYIFVYNEEGIINKTQFPGKELFPRNFLYTELEKNDITFLVLNLHGYWEPAPKYDTRQRFIQSQKILDFIEKYDCPKIVAGDFNLSIDTLSIKMIDEKLKNLIKEYGEKTTRSELYDPAYKAHDKFADYIFVSKEVDVNDFKVLKDEVSDHLPLLLDFEV